jgi:hypothetical protein
MTPGFTNRATPLDARVASALGATVAGGKWALKALHPNGEGVTAAAGIPDHTHIPVTTPEFRSNFVIAPTTLDGNDDVDILIPPFPDIACLYRRYKSAAPPAGNELGWTPVFYPAVKEKISVVQFENTDDETNYLLPVYGSEFGGLFSRVRAMYKGCTVNLDAPALSDQGRIVAGQLAMDMEVSSSKRFVASASISGAPPGTNIHVTGIPTIDFGANMPLTEDALFQVTPGAVVLPAREGCYMPMRFRDPVHLFNDSTPPLEDGTKADPSLTTGLRILTTGETALTRANGNPGDIDTVFSAGGIDNMLTGLILMRGIDKNANVQVKFRNGVEAQVSSVSALAPFQHASPPLDRLAIDMVTEIAQETGMAYAACYNDDDSFMGILKQILGIVGPVARGIGGLGLPIVSNIAGGIGGMLERLNLGAPGHTVSRVRRAFNAYR